MDNEDGMVTTPVPRAGGLLSPLGPRAGGSVLVLGVCLRERSGDPPEPLEHLAPLTRREKEVLDRIALGEVTADICAGLHIAPDTVRARSWPSRCAHAACGEGPRVIVTRYGDGVEALSDEEILTIALESARHGHGHDCEGWTAAIASQQDLDELMAQTQPQVQPPDAAK